MIRALSSIVFCTAACMAGAQTQYVPGKETSRTATSIVFVSPHDKPVPAEENGNGFDSKVCQNRNGAYYPGCARYCVKVPAGDLVNPELIFVLVGEYNDPKSAYHGCGKDGTSCWHGWINIQAREFHQDEGIACVYMHNWAQRGREIEVTVPLNAPSSMVKAGRLTEEAWFQGKPVDKTQYKGVQ